MREGETLEDYDARMNQEATQTFWNSNPYAATFLRTTMPLASQMIFSKYISKTDVPAPIPVTIRGVTLDSAGRNGEDPRWLMYFHELRKALRLNNTTIRQLEQAFGPNSDAWIGRKVRLYVDPNVTMAGQVVGGVRLQMPRGAAPPGYVHPTSAAGATPRFDPMTGQPLQMSAQTGMPASAPAFDPATGEISAPTDPDFDDDIPF